MGAVKQQLRRRESACRTADGRAVADAAHDLGAPLAIVRAHCVTVLEDPRLPDEVRAELEAMSHAADDLAGRAQELLDLAGRLEQMGTVQRRQIDFAALVHEVADPLDTVAAERGVRLVVTTPETLPARVDPRRMGSVTGNLVSNALRYASRVVRVDLARRGAWARLEVADDGPGIPPDLAETAFVRYRHGNGSPGAGIGLALVREHVDLHGGTVHVGRAPEGGALFAVELPR